MQGTRTFCDRIPGAAYPDMRGPGNRLVRFPGLLMTTLPGPSACVCQGVGSGSARASAPAAAESWRLAWM